jgi:hypothetical protein
MATKLVAVKLKDGSQLMVEVDEPPAPVGVTAVGLGKSGEIEFDTALDHIKKAADQLQSALSSIAVPPDACEISFGIKLSASAGVILAKAGTEANFGIKMNWSKGK